MNKNNINTNISLLKKEIDNTKVSKEHNTPLKILAATKYFNLEQTKEILNNPHIDVIGENRAQDAIEKLKQLQIEQKECHFIGHLQKNKIKQVITQFDCIQSLDSFQLIEKINSECKKQNKHIRGLIQINASNESNKYGFNLKEVEKNIERFFLFPHLKIQGIMMIAPNTKDSEKIRYAMKETYHIFSKIKKNNPHFVDLSMGMSNDFKIAIQEGSTMIRIGRSLLK